MEALTEPAVTNPEKIAVLPVNPFVSVSYSNDGNNGGQQSGGITEGGQKSAKLPYTIMKDGAFRPPVLLQEDLLPLSRIPRGRTTAISNAGFTDFSRKMRVCGTAQETKEVKNDTIKGFVRPTAVYKIETPLQKPFEVKYVIQPFIKTSATSGVRTMDITNQHVGNPTKEIQDNPMHALAQSNLTNILYDVNNNEFHSGRYIQDPLSHHIASNISCNNNYNGENTEFHADRFMQDPLAHHAISNISSTNYNCENNEFNSDRYIQDPLAHHHHN